MCIRDSIYPVTVTYNKDQAVVTLGDPIKNDRKGKKMCIRDRTGAWQ